VAYGGGRQVFAVLRILIPEPLVVSMIEIEPAEGVRRMGGAYRKEDKTGMAEDARH